MGAPLRGGFALRALLVSSVPRLPRSARLLLIAGGAAFTMGCAGGSPLLHPARTLARGDVRAQAGMSAHFAAGDLSKSMADAREVAAQNPVVPRGPGSDPVYARGALVSAAVSPGVAPFVAARTGVGASFEGGLGYTGRAVRIDLRRSFALSDTTDLSLGLGISAPLYGRDTGSLPNVDLSKLRGYGADVPILVGWESTASLYKVWAGARGGYEHVSLENVSSDPRPGVPLGGIPLDADRFWAGGVLGLAVGFRSLHVAIELQAAYTSIRGTYNENTERVSGFSLTPATALGWDF